MNHYAEPMENLPETIPFRPEHVPGEREAIDTRTGQETAVPKGATSRACEGPSHDPVTETGWPAMSFGPVPSVEPFPVEVLPRPVAEFVIAVSGSIGCPPDFVGLPALVVAGAAVGRSAGLLLKPGYVVSTALYAMNVGGPASGKSPALDAAVRPLWNIDKRLHEDYRRRKAEYDARMREYEDAPKGEKPPVPALPVMESAVVEDITSEALALHLSFNPRGLLLSRDEGTAWVASLGQYKNGRGADREFFLSALYGKPIRADRKLSPEPIRVLSPFVSVVGNLPPDMIEKFREERSRADGFLERILFAFPDPLPKNHWTEEGDLSSVSAGWSKIIETLYALPMFEGADGPGSRIVGFTPEAKAAWVRLYNAYVDGRNAATADAGDAAIEGKLTDFTARLVLILHMLHVAAEMPGRTIVTIPPVPASVVEGAFRLRGYFRSHCLRVRENLEGKGFAGAPKGARLVRSWIENHPDKDRFSASELSQTYSPTRGYDRAMFEDGLKWLAARGCIRPVERTERVKGKVGRNPSPSWEIHPDFRRLLGNQEIQETPRTAVGDDGPGGTLDSPMIPDVEQGDLPPFTVGKEATDSSSAA